MRESHHGAIQASLWLVFPLLMNCPPTPSSKNQSKENQTGRWKTPCFCVPAENGGWRGKMPFAACLGACPTGEEAACQMEGFEQLLAAEICLMMQRRKGVGRETRKDWRERTPMLGFSGYPGSPQPLRLSFPNLPPLASSWSWLGCAHHGVEVQGRRVNQSKLPNTSLFCGGFGGG